VTRIEKRENVFTSMPILIMSISFLHSKRCKRTFPSVPPVSLGHLRWGHVLTCKLEVNERRSYAFHYILTTAYDRFLQRCRYRFEMVCVCLYAISCLVSTRAYSLQNPTHLPLSAIFIRRRELIIIYILYYKVDIRNQLKRLIRVKYK